MSDSDQRKFFLHAAHDNIGVSTPVASVPDDLSLEVPTTDVRVDSLRVCLLSGSPADKSHASLDVLAGFLGKNYPISCSKAWNATSENGVTNLDELEWCDCLLLFSHRMALNADQLQRIRRYCARGGSIVGLRSTGRALQQWPELDSTIFGGKHRGKCNNRSTEINLVDDARENPLLANVEPFISRSPLCKQGEMADDAEVLLTGTSYGRVEPVAWSRVCNGGKIFYTSLGHPDDFYHPSFLHLLVNAISWTTGRQL